MSAEWVKLDSSFFQQGDAYTLDSGWMSIDEAKEKCMSQGDNAAGICIQDGDDSHCYCAIVKTGTQRYTGSGFYCLVYKVCLPPDDGTLFEDPDNDEAATDYDWQRPGRGDGLGDDKKAIKLFDSIDPSDLSQGGLGDCWLISSFAAMAEFPDQLKALITPGKIAEDGQYTVQLYSYAEQQMKQIVLDDRLPVNGSREAYVKITDTGEIWPCLLEKAFAKYSGGYDELAGGVCQFAFGAMTGCTDLYYCSLDDSGESWNVYKTVPKTDQVHGGSDMSSDSTPSTDEFLQQLADWDNQSFLICAGSHAGSDSDTSDLGVVQGHAYTILQVKLNVAGSGFDLMQLRNPWGTGEWAGDWSDNSSLWDEHPEVAAELGHEEADDGLFWMTYEDFCSSYSAVFLCKKNMGQNRGKIQQMEATNPTVDPAVAAPEKVSPGLAKKRGEIMKVLKACGGAQLAKNVGNCSIM
eukprot:gnl/MRDRNA2_/MRDRNA2_87967_c0_seq1.p1 gnl/MRDRNA2_/MRDRNA2_87967_c0~~gnl/MRDRNA2_/MRDRNA2_87967_c0_seq1.p1  ORF type:complete len:495 (+),score=121.84 gnl/MRDRNA2_/MRDRNA2_87967_c0_seq1:95-1486(+)